MIPLGATVTGIPALLIILAILLVLIVGAVTVMRMLGRGAKKVANAASDTREPRASRDV